jgi:hypothetical protein
MRASAVPLSVLFNTTNKAYVIPNYQRPFAWDGDKACELLDSILTDSDENESITSLGTLLFFPVSTTNNHPFGNNTPASNAVNTLWEIIDGQQRMTVFSIIGYILWKKLKELQDNNGLAYNPSLDLRYFFGSKNKEDGTRVPSIIRDTDNFDTGYRSEIAKLHNFFNGITTSMPNDLGNNIKNVYDEITNWVNTNLNGQNFSKFCEYLLKNCTYVQVEADDQNTAFTMFETLNSTSVPLTAFEVYKSQIIRRLNESDISFKETDALLDYANAERDSVTKNSNTLAFAHSQANIGKIPKKHFLALKKYLDKCVDKDSLISLELSAKFLKEIWNDQSCKDGWFDDQTKDCIRFLKAMKHEAPMPMMMRYYLSNPSDLKIVSKIVVAFFTLWRCGIPTNKLPDAYRALLKDGGPDNMALKGGVLKDPIVLAAYFRQKLEERWTNGNKNTYEEKWISNYQAYLNYESLPIICRLFVLLDIESSLKANLLPDDPWTITDDIEHIAPSSSLIDRETLNSLGNLTFLPASINRSIQNIAWDKKQEVYSLLSRTVKQNASTFNDSTPLPPALVEYLSNPQSNVLAHLDSISKNENWGELEIKNRNKAMLQKIFKTLYMEWLNPKV